MPGIDQALAQTGTLARIGTTDEDDLLDNADSEAELAYDGVFDILGQTGFDRSLLSTCNHLSECRRQAVETIRANRRAGANGKAERWDTRAYRRDPIASANQEHRGAQIQPRAERRRDEPELNRTKRPNPSS